MSISRTRSQTIVADAVEENAWAQLGFISNLLVRCRPSALRQKYLTCCAWSASQLRLTSIGKTSGLHLRLVKLLLPSKSHLSTALSNSYRLRGSSFKNIFVRKSMTTEERSRELFGKSVRRAMTNLATVFKSPV
ncbi:hypothetical protein OSTOST_04167, partial [Ostertagia ostertagi]